jgi:hypothetical protein
MTCEINSVRVISNREKIVDIGHHLATVALNQGTSNVKALTVFTLRARYLLGFGWSHKKYSLSAGTLTQGLIIIKYGEVTQYGRE